MKKADIVLSGLTLLLSLYVFVETAQFPQDQVLLVGPAFFPRLLAGSMAILALNLLFQALKGKSTKAPTFNAQGGVQRLLLTLLVLVIYIVLLPKLGFIVAGVLFLLVLMFLFGLRKYLIILFSSIAVTVAVYFTFHNLLNIALPVGLLGL